MLGNHNEQDDRSGEEINGFWEIWLLQVDLRRHVVESSKLGLQIARSVSAFNWSCKSEIGKFEIEIGIEQKILWFEISMGETLRMAMIKTRQKLFEEVPGNVLREWTCVSDEVEQLTAKCELQDDVVHFFFLTAILDIGVFSILELLNDVVMFEFFHGLDFGLNKLLFSVVKVTFHDFDGNFATGFSVLGKLYFAAGSRTKGPEDSEFSKSTWHLYFVKIIEI